MTIKLLVLIALQVSIFSTVFGFGLHATFDDLLFLVRRPGLFLRSFVAMFAIMPVLAVALARTFDFRPPIEIALVALAISPVPPLMPRKATKSGGRASYGLSLTAWLALLSVVTVPAAMRLLQLATGGGIGMAPWPIARVVLTSTLVPLLAGVIVRRRLPGIAARLEPLATVIGNTLLPAGIVVLLIGAWSAMWALVGDGTVLVIVLFTIAGLGIGYVLGQPDPEVAGVLALATAWRHPAIAFAVATANYPDQHVGAAILLYMLVNGIASLPFVVWRERHATVRA